MNFETKFRVETPYGVKIFRIFHFQKHAPNMLKKLAKKNFKNQKSPLGLYLLLWNLVHKIKNDEMVASHTLRWYEELTNHTWFDPVKILCQRMSISYDLPAAHLQQLMTEQ